MIINSCVNKYKLLNITEKTIFDIFKESQLYAGQTEDHFFWLEGSFMVDDISEKFKVGL